MRNPIYYGDRNKTTELYMGLKNKNFAVGVITSIDIDKGKFDMRLTNRESLQGILINMGSNTGIHHGIRAMPFIGDYVLVAYGSEGIVYHVATIPYKYFQLIQTIGVDNTSNLSMRKLNEGEVEIGSCTVDGLPAASITLLNTGRIEMNANGHQFVIDPDLGFILEQNLITLKGGNTRIKHGWVERLDPTTGDYIPLMSGGVPYEGIGEPLQEVYVAVNQPTNLSDQDIGDPDIKIHIADEILDDLGLPTLDGGGKKLQANIQFKSGASITINEDGVINVWEANPLTKPLKNVARNGDKVDNGSAGSWTAFA